jgi:hypothetical protein
MGFVGTHYKGAAEPVCARPEIGFRNGAPSARYLFVDFCFTTRLSTPRREFFAVCLIFTVKNKSATFKENIVDTSYFEFHLGVFCGDDSMCRNIKTLASEGQ